MSVIKGSPYVTGVGTNFTQSFKVGDYFHVLKQKKKIISIQSDTLLQADSAYKDTSTPGRIINKIALTVNDGYVGIGTDTPQGVLQVEKHHNSVAGFVLRNTHAGTLSQPRIRLESDEVSATIGVRSSQHHSLPNQLVIQSFVTGLSGKLSGVAIQNENQVSIGKGDDSKDAITAYFDTASARTGFGTASPNSTIDVRGSIQYSGSIRDLSDSRLKENVQDLNAGLAEIMAVQTVSFSMIGDEKNETEYGVIAQDLEKVLPELVDTQDTAEGYKSVNYMGLIAPMIKAMQEQQAMIKAQQAEIDKLKTLMGVTE